MKDSPFTKWVHASKDFFSHIIYGMTLLENASGQLFAFVEREGKIWNICKNVRTPLNYNRKKLKFNNKIYNKNDYTVFQNKDI